MEIEFVSKLSYIIGNSLNEEERFFLEKSMLQTKLEQKLTGKMLFWGKIFGTSKDYLVAVNIANREEEFPDKTFFYCNSHSGNYTLLPLPKVLSTEFQEIAKGMNSHFTGDSSFFELDSENPQPAQQDTINNDSEEPDAEEIERTDDPGITPAQAPAANPPDKLLFMELHRLSYVVQVPN
jgi:hypothetical protein